MKIENIMNKSFKRVRSITDIIIVALTIIVGLVLSIFPSQVSVHILGYLLVLTGFILIFILKSAYKDEETGELYKRKQKYFAQSKQGYLSQALKGKIEEIDLSGEDEGSGLRIDIFYNNKKGKVFVQLHEYIPYVYQPCSDFYEFNIKEAEKLLK